MRPIVLVALGSALGGVARYGVALWLPRAPFATLLVNVLGCFLIALLFEAGLRGLAMEWRLLLSTGFCGGFTTYSTFNLELVQLWERRPLHGGLYLGATLLLCLLAYGLGAACARLLLVTR